MSSFNQAIMGGYVKGEIKVGNGRAKFTIVVQDQKFNAQTQKNEYVDVEWPVSYQLPQRSSFDGSKFKDGYGIMVVGEMMKFTKDGVTTAFLSAKRQPIATMFNKYVPKSQQGGASQEAGAEEEADDIPF